MIFIPDNYNYYTIRKTYFGKRKTFYGKTKKEALQKMQEYEKKEELVSDNEIQNMTFAEYCTEWLTTWRSHKIKAKTYDYYEGIINNYIVDSMVGNIPIKVINTENPKAVTNKFKKHLKSFSHLSRSTVNGIHTLINQVCKYGYDNGDFNVEFYKNVDKLSEDEVQTKAKELISFDYSDVMKLWDEALRKNTKEFRINGVPGSYVYGIAAYAILFCCFTGLRWGELTALTWGDVLSSNGKYFIHINKQYVSVKNRKNSDTNYRYELTTPKSKSGERYIPLSSKAVEILEMIQERYSSIVDDRHLIFSTTNNPYSNSSANRLLKAMCIRADLPVISLHQLRHSFASILLNEDEKNLYAVSSLLGHSSSDVTYKRYIDIFEKKKVETIDIFDKLS